MWPATCHSVPMSDVISTARQASDHPALETAARVGYAVSGLLHLLIGWIALQVAWGLGGSGKDADQSGALQSLAGNGAGKLALWVGVLFILAAMHANPEESKGLDGALRTLKDQPFGPGLLTAVALGIGAYGLYSFSRARHARV